MSIYWLETDELFPTVRKQLKQADIILDIGCGILPQNMIQPQVHICCEPFEQYVEHLKKKIENEQSRYYVVINASWADAVRLFPSKSVDTVFLLDVIEHLEKNEATQLLKATEDIAKKQIAIYTPLGFVPQTHLDGKDAWGLDGGKWQEHKSGWTPEEFDISWDVYVAKEFHFKDNLGKPHEKPFGALWAVKNFPESLPNKKSMRRRIHKIIDGCLDIMPSKRRKLHDSYWVVD